MQTLYGIKITDRVTVRNTGTSFVAYFDNQLIPDSTSSNGTAAVKKAINWLQQRAEYQKIAQQQQAEQELQDQRDSDDLFIEALASKLGIHTEDLDTLIEIANRRNN